MGIHETLTLRLGSLRREWKKRWLWQRRRILCLAAGGAAMALLGMPPLPVGPPPPAFASGTGDTGQSAAEVCLGCHGSEGMTLSFPSGETVSLLVDPQKFASSVHGKSLNCTDCHTGAQEIPHPQLKVKSRREYTLAQYESCKRCHFANYTKTLDSVHFDLVSKGDRRAPICMDCHGAHDIQRSGEHRARISQTCARCHGEIYASYIRSVHGKAILNGGNTDVPVCTDCHQSHSIEDPRTASFRLRIPDLCASCHSDKVRMKKYGISTNVLDTYLEDFHGMTIALYRKQGFTQKALQAVCTDCHGIHDIQPTTGPGSLAMKANLVKVCQRCHGNVSENFPAAWLSHYEPSPKKFPLVYYVKLMYRIFIPFVIGGLILHIILHVWRMATNR